MRIDLSAKLGVSEWPLHPLWSLVSRVRDKNAGLIETNLLSLSYGRVIRKDMESSKGLKPGSYETYTRVKPGDIVLRMTDLQNDQKSIRTGLVEEDGIITSAYVNIRPDQDRVSPAFLVAVLRTYDNEKVFYEMGSGVRQNLTFDELGQLPIPLPPITVQHELTRKIKRETQKVDTLLSDIEALRELLVERRSALITDVITGRKEMA